MSPRVTTVIERSSPPYRAASIQSLFTAPSQFGVPSICDPDVDDNTAQLIGKISLVGTGVAGATAVVLAFFSDFKGTRKNEKLSLNVFGDGKQGGVLLTGSF